MKWSQLQKRIHGFFPTQISKRFRIQMTTYRPFYSDGRCWFEIDGKEIINMCDFKYYPQMFSLEREEPQQVARRKLQDENLFPKGTVYYALLHYINLSIDDIIASENLIIRAVGMLDSRLGKRRLKKVDVAQENPLVRRLYLLRCDVEGIYTGIEEDLTSRVDAQWIKPSKKDPEIAKQADAKLIASKATKLTTFISKVYSGTITEEQVHNDVQKPLFTLLKFTEAKERECVADRLVYLDKKSKLLQNAQFVKGVINILGDSAHWIRNLHEWEPNSHNSDKQFSSLLRYLFAEYEVPQFMNDAYHTGNEIHKYWFRHIGTGSNIRTAEGLPIPLTKKVAHHFLEAPESYPINGALRYAQIVALGGDRYLADAVLETRLLEGFSHDEFWQSVLRFFVNNPMLDRVHVLPIIDFIWHRKFEPRMEFVEEGVLREVGPEQPHFSMRGRTAESLLAHVEEWHRRLGREVKSGKFQWSKSDIADFSYVEGSEESKNMKRWTIRELLTSNQLIAEGRAMRHCVASYAYSCHSGKTSIWTMESHTKEESVKHVTIEVSRADKKIRQIRGKANRLASDKERSVIGRWVQGEGLELGTRL